MSISTGNPQYSRIITVNHPGLIMILLDQSKSMAEDIGGSSKAVVAAAAVNRVIYQIQLSSRSGQTIKDKCFIGVIGYGSSIVPVLGNKISEIAASFIRTEIVTNVDKTGGIIETEMPVWVEPKAENSTPMAEAMDTAYNLIESWIIRNKESFPPIVINITDGEPNDINRATGYAPQTAAVARRLMQLATNDGNLLLFNAHISGSSSYEVKLPAVEDPIPDLFGRFLFNISSIIPERLLKSAKEVGLAVQPGSRGCVFNASPETLIRLLIFGSSVAR